MQIQQQRMTIRPRVLDPFLISRGPGSDDHGNDERQQHLHRPASLIMNPQSALEIQDWPIRDPE
jgi:hypothetical protein